MSGTESASTFLETDADESPFGRFAEDRSQQLDLLGSIAFDEMNLTDIAIGTLADPVTVEAGETVEFGPGLRLTAQPSALTGLCQLPARHSQRTLLALMWLTKEQNRFTNNRVKTKLRTLYERYMFPNRTYSANNKVLASVLEEIHRMAACRIWSDRWVDRKTGKKRVVDLALIADVLYPPDVTLEDIQRMIRDENGRGLGDLEIELTWGPHLYESIAHKYTKALDAPTFLAIERPLDQKFYRFLDRQCWPGHRAAGKAWEYQWSCTKFAKQVLGMRAKVIDRGGRQASTYIVKKLQDSLGRLNGLGPAHFRMEIDKSRDDHALAFRRIEKPVNEVSEVDGENDLHIAFLRLAHSVPEAALKDAPPPARGARRDYARWLERYKGIHSAVELLELAVEEFRKDPQRKTDRPRTIKDLSRYQTSAEGRWMRKSHKEKTEQSTATQLELRAVSAENVSRLFGVYLAVLSHTRLDEEHEVSIRELAEQDLAEEEIPPQFLTPVLSAKLHGRRQQTFGAISQEEFYSLQDDVARTERLREAHADFAAVLEQLELLGVIQGEGEGEDLAEEARFERLLTFQPKEVVIKAFFRAPVFSREFKEQVESSSRS